LFIKQEGQVPTGYIYGLNKKVFSTVKKRKKKTRREEKNQRELAGVKTFHKFVSEMRKRKLLFASKILM
jgi:hypothetical protein